jgi:cytochrome oxidase assembly protein ShyY1
MSDGSLVLVSRGWVSSDDFPHVQLLFSKLRPTEVELVGIVRAGEDVSPKHNPHRAGTRIFHWCELDAMARSTGITAGDELDLHPWILDCLEECPVSTVPSDECPIQTDLPPPGEGAPPSPAPPEVAFTRHHPDDYLTFAINPVPHAWYAAASFALAAVGGTSVRSVLAVARRHR